ncbi:MAG: type II toxin-antitoxin system prevent-host-death family antitoxin [Clostridia bacterium]|nr:type II toxin-antitoxin system prevent-host-death family antitoxin [Clostridia bacterium]
MLVTATEFRTNLGHYLKQVLTEDIWITKNGKTIAKLTNPNVSGVDSIAGILKKQIPDDTDRNSLKEERLLSEISIPLYFPEVILDLKNPRE